MPPKAKEKREDSDKTPQRNDKKINMPGSAMEVTREVFDAAPIGMAMFDDSYNLVECNRFVLDMLGVEKDHFLNRFPEMLPDNQPDGSKSIDKALDCMKRALAGEKPTLEWMFRSSAGEIIPTEVTFSRIPYKGMNAGLSFIYDLRTIRNLESSIIRLKSESEKIYYDPLTGIFNRRFFDENLDRILKTISRSGGILSLMMIDIDNFKNFNDTYGHSAGDECIKSVAENLAKCLTRADDFIVRYGGDEFAVVLPNTGEDGARHVAEKMIDNVRKCGISHAKNGGIGFVTISVGCTTGWVDTQHTANNYVDHADELLYRSKQSGRNVYSFGWLG